jgi:hypothetical protein
MSPTRRTPLQACSLALGGLSGCLTNVLDTQPAVEVDEPRALLLENTRGESVTVTLTITREGDQVHSETYRLPATSERRQVYETTRIGLYRIEVRSSSGVAQTVDWRVCTGYYDGEILVCRRDGELQVKLNQFHGDPEAASCEL